MPMQPPQQENQGFGGVPTDMINVPGFNPDGGKPQMNDPNVAMGMPMQPNGTPMAGAPGNEIDDLQARMDALKNL